MRQDLRVGLLGLLLLLSCQGPPGPSGSDMPLQATGGDPPARPSRPGPTASPDADSTPTGRILYEADWSKVAVGSEPADFGDPSRQDNPPYWLAAGRWAVERVRTPAFEGLAYRASEERPQPYLSFRVLQLPPLPARFRVQATVQAVSSPHFKAPVGEISIIPYYRDPTHYLEVLFTNDHIGLWLADGAEPDTDRGWTGLHFLPVRTDVGQLQRVAIDMDLASRRVTVHAGDVTYALEHPFLDPGRPHGVAVRSAGNSFNLIALRVQQWQP